MPADWSRLLVEVAGMREAGGAKCVETNFPERSLISSESSTAASESIPKSPMQVFEAIKSAGAPVYVEIIVFNGASLSSGSSSATDDALENPESLSGASDVGFWTTVGLEFWKEDVTGRVHIIDEGENGVDAPFLVDVKVAMSRHGNVFETRSHKYLARRTSLAAVNEQTGYLDERVDGNCVTVLRHGTFVASNMAVRHPNLRQCLILVYDDAFNPMKEVGLIDDF
ncbi:unnamed protein product [Alternaria alternata]